MQTVSTIRLDIAKSVVQLHSIDEAGQTIVRRQLKRRHVLASRRRGADVRDDF
jgi:transposase